MGWSWTIFLSSDAIFRSHKISQSQVKGLPKKDTLHNILNLSHIISSQDGSNVNIISLFSIIQKKNVLD